MNTLTYHFDGFVLDPTRRRLMRNSGDPVAIQAKAFDALVCLVERAGEVVPRGVLTKALWPTTVVEDNNLSQTIRALRNALGDTGTEHRYVVTVPRRGYQFTAHVIQQHLSAVPDRRKWQPVWLAFAVVIAIAAVTHFGAQRPAPVPDRIVETPTKPDWSPRPAHDRKGTELRHRLGLQRT
jgi:DNA-binding winged helix-turn-helix (wHTH) protein